MGYTIGDHDERPWGTWEIIGTGQSYAVKRILVRSSRRLSLQRHRFRAEHWVIVQGEAIVSHNRAQSYIAPGGSVIIERGDIHRIENPGRVDLVFIEVQHGEHLDENDIERLEDDYGRV